MRPYRSNHRTRWPNHRPGSHVGCPTPPASRAMCNRPIPARVQETRRSSSRMARTRRASPPQIGRRLLPPGGSLDLSSNTRSRRTRSADLPTSYGVRHCLLRFATFGLPVVRDVICPIRQAYAPNPPLLGTGRTIPAGAGPVERHHSSSTPTRRGQPTANVTSASSRERLQIDGGLRPYAPLREIFGEPISPSSSWNRI
jgi:hypothetical protein